MRIVFAGTPDLAACTLQALIACPEYQVVGVLTTLDKKVGRGRKIECSPVKSKAIEYGIPYCEANTLKEDTRSWLESKKPDLIIVVAYGVLFSESILKMPRYGCINIHFSLLPRWRGASPIQHALLYGDVKTGVSVMLMDKGLDTGPVFRQVSLPISFEDTTETLSLKLTSLGIEVLLEVLDEIDNEAITPIPQMENREERTACKIHKAMGEINWQDSAQDIANKVRAFIPWPIAFTFFKGTVLRLLKVTASDSYPIGNAEEGTVLAANKDILAIRTGREGAILVHAVQFPGKKIISTRDFLNTKCLIVGSKPFRKLA